MGKEGNGWIHDLITNYGLGILWVVKAIGMGVVFLAFAICKKVYSPSTYWQAKNLTLGVDALFMSAVVINNCVHIAIGF